VLTSGSITSAQLEAGVIVGEAGQGVVVVPVAAAIVEEPPVAEEKKEEKKEEGKEESAEPAAAPVAPAAAAPDTPTAPAAPIAPAPPTTYTEARAAGMAEAYQHFADIEAVCRTFGHPEAAAIDFIRRQLTVSQVCAEILVSRAEAGDSQNIRSTILPNAGMEKGSNDPKNSPVVKAAEALAARMKGGH
jgi:hypothetical protein